MVVHTCRLEHLPNEIVIEILKYLNARDLVHGFYNLNSRFNYLIQSLTHLIYSTSNNDHDALSYPFIYTLIINNKIEDKLNAFSNMHRLVLDYVTNDLISGFNFDTLPYLEYLSVSHKVSPFYMSDLRRKIFSNTFPNLKYCYVSRMKPPYPLDEWTQSPSLRYLILNDIDASIYTSVLLACPNLYFLKFKLPTRSKIQSNTPRHFYLKRLTINMSHDEWPWDDHIVEDYLYCVPNLEQFKICRSLTVDLNTINFFKQYDWFLAIISKNLFVLDRFKYVLFTQRSGDLSEYDFKDICRYLKGKFSYSYKGRYQSQLVGF